MSWVLNYGCQESASISIRFLMRFINLYLTHLETQAEQKSYALPILYEALETWYFSMSKQSPLVQFLELYDMFLRIMPFVSAQFGF